MNKLSTTLPSVKEKLISLLILTILFISIAASAATPADSLPTIPNTRSSRLRSALTWVGEFPYSAGVEFSCLFEELIDLNFGFGLGMSGAKAGFGTRIYPLRRHNLSPMAGIYLYIATGLWDMEVSNDEGTAMYRITPDGAVLVSGGIRYRFGIGEYLTGAIGYSFPFIGEKARYISGSTDPALKQQMDKFATGGFSINVGIIIKLNRGSYRK